ncbi:sensor histidine kinase, partial [Enterobacter mori]
IVLNLIVLGIAYIDFDISVNSILYIIVLNLGLSVVFLIFTYIKEIRFYLHLENNIEPEALKHKALADTTFQKEIVDYLYQKITDQKMVVTEQKKQIRST